VGVQRGLILRSVTDETLAVGEGDIRGRGAVSLVVCDDLHSIVLPDTDARVRRAEINTDGFNHDDSCL
jgi:hypothetical protein